MTREAIETEQGGVSKDAAGCETRRILWIILGLNWGVAAAKLIYGWMTDAVSMQADGIHSSFDGMSNVIGLIGLWVAAHPPDAGHPYGHKKYETFAAAAIGLLLFGTCLYILRNSYLHWREGVVPEVTAISFAIMLVTMAVNWGVMTWERRRGEVLQSEILVADSLHTASDILSSFSVLIGLAAVAAGYPLLDPIAGVVIAGFIGHTGVLVLKEASQSLAVWSESATRISLCRTSPRRRSQVMTPQLTAIVPSMIAKLMVVTCGTMPSRQWR